MNYYHNFFNREYGKGYSIKDNVEVLIILFFISCFFSINFLLMPNYDNTWLTHVADSWLNNGIYIRDYFETNPPLSFYIYLPVTFVMKLFSINFKFAFGLYFSLILLSSLLLIQSCLTLTWHQQKKRQILITAICFCFCILPLYQNGQRDIISLVLITPHVFYVFLDKVNQNRLSIRKKYFLIGCAVIGYMLKPYFLITWFVLFLTKFFLSSFSEAVRSTNFRELLLSGLLYLLIVFIFNHEYIDNLFYIGKLYYGTLQPNRWQLFLDDKFWVFRIYIVALIFFAIYVLNRKKEDDIGFVFFVLATGFTLCFLAQGIGHSYHSFPPISGSCCLILYVILSYEGSIYAPKTMIFLLGTISCCAFAVSITDTVRSQELAGSCQTILQKIPKGKSYSFLSYYPCASITFRTENTQSKTSFQAPFWLTWKAYRRQDRELTNHWFHLMRQDLLYYMPAFLIVPAEYGSLDIKLRLMKEIFSQGDAKKLWNSYKIYKKHKDYYIFYLSTKKSQNNLSS